MKEQIENNFTFHAATPKRAEKYDTIRNTAKDFALQLNELCPESRELSLAITKLEEVSMWANAAIARNPEKKTEAEKFDEAMNDISSLVVKAGMSSAEALSYPTPWSTIDLFDEPSTREYTREEIVAYAKKEIDNLKNERGYYEIDDNRMGSFLFNMPFSCNLEFVVDSKNRTVVALMKGLHSGGVRSRGKAVADPKDVFNEDIGKAIALYRAMDEEVPDYLIYAPKPKGVRVGDIVGCRNNSLIEPYKINKIAGDRAEDNDGTYLNMSETYLIDDSDRKAYK